MNHIIRYALDDFHIDKDLYNTIGIKELKEFTDRAIHQEENKKLKSVMYTSQLILLKDKKRVTFKKIRFPDL